MTKTLMDGQRERNSHHRPKAWQLPKAFTIILPSKLWFIFFFSCSSAFLSGTYISEDNLLEDGTNVDQVLLAEPGCDATVQKADTQWIGIWLHIHYKGVTANVYHHNPHLVPSGCPGSDVLHHHVAGVQVSMYQVVHKNLCIRTAR